MSQKKTDLEVLHREVTELGLKSHFTELVANGVTSLAALDKAYGSNPEFLTIISTLTVKEATLLITRAKALRREIFPLPNDGESDVWQSETDNSQCQKIVCVALVVLATLVCFIIAGLSTDGNISQQFLRIDALANETRHSAIEYRPQHTQSDQSDTSQPICPIPNVEFPKNINLNNSDIECRNWRYDIISDCQHTFEKFDFSQNPQQFAPLLNNTIIVAIGNSVDRRLLRTLNYLLIGAPFRDFKSRNSMYDLGTNSDTNIYLHSLRFGCWFEERINFITNGIGRIRSFTGDFANIANHNSYAKIVFVFPLFTVMDSANLYIYTDDDVEKRIHLPSEGNVTFMNETNALLIENEKNRSLNNQTIAKIDAFFDVVQTFVNATLNHLFSGIPNVNKVKIILRSAVAVGGRDVDPRSVSGGNREKHDFVNDFAAEYVMQHKYPFVNMIDFTYDSNSGNRHICEPSADAGHVHMAEVARRIYAQKVINAITNDDLYPWITL